MVRQPRAARAPAAAAAAPPSEAAADPVPVNVGAGRAEGPPRVRLAVASPSPPRSDGPPPGLGGRCGRRSDPGGPPLGRPLRVWSRDPENTGSAPRPPGVVLAETGCYWLLLDPVVEEFR